MTGVATAFEVAEAADHATAPSGGRQSIAGTARLTGFVLRRDRVRILLWFAAIVGLIVVTAASITGLYDTPEQLESYARTVRGNSALIIQAGPGYGLDQPTTGAVMMNELSVSTIIAVGLMGVFMVVRHTRTEEESERAELVRAAPVGRDAPLAAAMIGTAIAEAVVATGAALALVAYGLPTTGSVAFGLAVFGAGLVFAGVAAVAAQVASGSRAALGLGGVAIGVAFVLRAVGDVGNGVLSWLSPIGWAQAIRAFADERWWVLLLPVVASAALVAGAVALQGRRDFGAGLVAQRPGAAAAGPRLSSPLGLAVRLQRASVLSWTIGLGLIAFFYGIVADQAESILQDNPEMEDFFIQLGQGSIVDAFLSTAALIIGLMATGFTISSVLRLRSEEMAGPRRRAARCARLPAGRRKESSRRCHRRDGDRDGRGRVRGRCRIRVGRRRRRRGWPEHRGRVGDGAGDARVRRHRVRPVRVESPMVAVGVGAVRLGARGGHARLGAEPAGLDAEPLAVPARPGTSRCADVVAADRGAPARGRGTRLVRHVGARPS